MRLPIRWCLNLVTVILFIVSFKLTLIWIRKYIDKNTHTEADSFSKNISVLDSYKKSKDLKYILLWTRRSYSPFDDFGNGTEAFIKNKCSFNNCYVTTSRDFFGGDLKTFDAIAFNGRNIRGFNRPQLPKERSSRQKYIFFNTESAVNTAICNDVFDDFFNWTATYKLNSDIVYPYMQIKNMASEEVGPKIDMKWNVSYADDTKFRYRRKAAVWVASNCHTKSRRERYVPNLKTELELYNQTLNLYGRCGGLECPRGRLCDNFLRNEYYFYLAFENSFAEDYVSEKVYFALNNDMVPVVFGGADYSRFLPPGSYIDATKSSLRHVAQTIAQVIKNQTYNTFFRWKQHYTYHRPKNICRVCDALNNQTMMETHTVYEDFRGWWNPSHMRGCRYRGRG